MVMGFHVLTGTGPIPVPAIRKITVADLVDCLRLGIADFWEKPSHYVFLCLIYPIAGVVLAYWSSRSNVLPLLYPLMSGFALLGPFAALGLYEISRRREFDLDTSWVHAFEVLRSPALGSIAGLGVLLLMVFTVWLASAQVLYEWLYGPDAPNSAGSFLTDILTTERGWTLIFIGNAIGLVFAGFVLCTTVIAFPLLLDRGVSANVAIRTSTRAVLANPVPMAVWGLIVALSLAAGTLPIFVGLALVLPILGHSTWHLYRKVVEPEVIEWDWSGPGL
jgi:uncharacterized membrane protein